jgi:hypothetical protein
MATVGQRVKLRVGRGVQALSRRTQLGTGSGVQDEEVER